MARYNITLKLVDVMTSREVSASSLDEAIVEGRQIKVSDIIGKHDWIDGDVEVVGVDEC